MPKVSSVMALAQKTKIPPNPPLEKGGNYKELLLKAPFGKGGFRGILKPASAMNLWQAL
jgi:hypothetical protein